jgi:N-acetyl-beta-hexosaminidase
MSIHVSPAFGPDNGVDPYKSIADTVRAIKPRALTPDQHADVLTLMEFMQEQCTKQHDLNIAYAAALAEREQELSRREQHVELKHRLALSVIATSKTARRGPGWRNLWR